MKKIFLSLILLGTLCSLSSCTTASAERDPEEYAPLYENRELKQGRYYLAGDDSQYIEISEDYGFRMHYDSFYEDAYEANLALIEQWEAEGDTEQLRLVLNDFRETAALRSSSSYYQITRLGGDILPKMTPEYVTGGGWVLTMPDENTIRYTDDKIFVYQGEAAAVSSEEESVVYENHEIKRGKYVLEGGDGSQYIEIGENYAFYMSYDCYPSICEQNRAYLDVLEQNGNTERLQEILDFYRQTADERSAFSYYRISPYSGALQPIGSLEETAEPGWVMSMPDENTIRYADGVLFVYRSE